MLTNNPPIQNGQVYFTDGNQFVDLPSEVIPRNLTSFTIEMWVTASTQLLSYFNMIYIIIHEAQAEAYITVNVDESSRFLRMEFNVMPGDEPNYGVSSSVNFDSLLGSHVVAVYTLNNYGRVYVNGVLAITTILPITSEELFFSPSGLSKSIRLGGRPVNPFYGSIDEFRVWQGALDEGAISEHASLGPNTLPSTSFAPTTTPTTLPTT